MLWISNYITYSSVGPNFSSITFSCTTLKDTLDYGIDEQAKTKKSTFYEKNVENVFI